MSSEKGFTSFGKFYVMGDPQPSYVDSLREQLIEIRENALKKQGYLIESNPVRITCGTCGKTSYNSNDAKFRYCVGCDKFHN